MPTLKLQDVSINYGFDGFPDRPVLLLSNSLGTNFSMWSPQVESLIQHFNLLRYDSRGQGGSSVPAGPYSIDQMGHDVLAMLDALKLNRVHFCGLSMGGMVGQWLGVHAPERLNRLILSNTAAKIGTPEGWNSRIDAVRQGGMQAVIPAILERWFTPDFRSNFPAVLDRTSSMLQSANIEGYVGSCAAVRDMDQRNDAHNITVPTLVICGTHDLVTPPSEADFLVAQIRSSQLLTLPAAHLANIEASSEFNQAVLDFLLHE